MSTDQPETTAGTSTGDDAQLAELSAMSTEELRHRAFALARHKHDLNFFWSIFKHLPAAEETEQLDASLGAVGATVDDAVALWREFTGHEYGNAEPLLRAAFIDYLVHGKATAA
jgi:hypothetical protein